MTVRDEILRHLERRDRLQPARSDEQLAWIAAAVELLLRAELQRQAQGGDRA